MKAIHAGLSFVEIAMLVCVLFAWGAPVRAQMPEESRQCLACHGMHGFSMALESGESLSLRIAPDALEKSVHAKIGCTVCHTEIVPADHMDLFTNATERTPIESAWAFSLDRVETCRACHADKQKEWEAGVHAALVAAGDKSGPLCTDCHSVHVMTVGAMKSAEAAPCASCHEPIAAAYKGSLHATIVPNGENAPLVCADCHNAHDVSVASSPAGPKNACFGCHENVLQKHRAWLPNTELHFDAVSCPVCHVPSADRRVHLQLVADGGSASEAGKSGVPSFAPPGKGTEAIALQTLSQSGDQGPGAPHMTLRGRLEVASGAQVHRLAPKAEAVRACETCHSADADAFKEVAVSTAGPGGLPVRHVVDGKVLSSLWSIGSIGGFYAIGGTRIQWLDVLLIVAVAAGVGLPAAHLLLGAVVRRAVKRRAKGNA